MPLRASLEVAMAWLKTSWESAAGKAHVLSACTQPMHKHISIANMCVHHQELGLLCTSRRSAHCTHLQVYIAQIGPTCQSSFIFLILI